eukprot:6736390-Prymnesium_polylepis.1
MAFGKLNDAKGADDLSGGVPHKTRTESQRYSEAKRREAERKRQEKAAATRKEAEEASARATAFQRAAMSMIKAPARASAGITAWKRPDTGLPINVDFCKVDACKVPDFGTLLKTTAGKDVQLLPTASTTLLIEAGCSAEKTRKLLAWLVRVLEENPGTPILFVTSRKTHADD